MKVRYYSHASFQVTGASGTRILLDPWLYNPICHTLWQFPECPIPLQEYLQQDILSISHDHADHFCPKTLSHFDRKIPIVIRKYGETNNPIKPVLVEMGFQTIVELENRQTFQFQELSLTQFWDFSTSDSALLIADGESTVFHQNDCMLPYDEATYIGENFNIDLALLFASSASVYPTFFKMPEDQKLQETIRRNEKVMERAAKYTHCLRVSHVIPCAGDMIRFRSPETDFFAGALPVEFRQFVAEKGYPFKVLTPNPGEFVDTSKLDRELEPLYSSRDVWIEHLNQFRQRNDIADITARLDEWEQHFSFDSKAFLQLMTNFCDYINTHFLETFKDEQILNSQISVVLNVVNNTEPRHYLIRLHFGDRSCQILPIDANTQTLDTPHMSLDIPSNYLGMVMEGVLNFDDLRGGLLMIDRPGEFTREEVAFWHFLSSFNGFYIQRKAHEGKSEFLGKFDKLIATSVSL